MTVTVISNEAARAKDIAALPDNEFYPDVENWQRSNEYIATLVRIISRLSRQPGQWNPLNKTLIASQLGIDVRTLRRYCNNEKYIAPYQTQFLLESLLRNVNRELEKPNLD